MNAIEAENAKAGTTEWELTNPVVMADRDGNLRTPAIEGYCSLTSVNIGGQIKFCVSTKDTHFSLKIYRMGHYAGAGGRLMATYGNLNGIDQPFPERGYGDVIDCDWTPQLSLTIPSDWVSGIYLGKLTAGQSGKQSYVIFVVRDDARSSPILFQSAVTTAQAYNGWGRCSYYPYSDTRGLAADVRAHRLSFNRPYFLAHYGELEPYPKVEVAPKAAGAGQLFAHFPWADAGRVQDCGVPAWEYNMVRWLEKSGYDVTYCTNIDIHEQPALLLSHKIFISVGHDEYWSRDMRIHVELARNLGINLAFFSANRIYRQVRFEADRNKNPNRIMAQWGDCEKDDPLQTSIENRVASSYDMYPYPNLSSEIRRTKWPETLLLGTTWATPDGTAVFHEDLIVKMPSHWAFAAANPAVRMGQVIPGVAGYEIDSQRSVDPHPPTLETIAESQHGGQSVVYTAESGATVFVAGTVQWSWGLDDFVIAGPDPRIPLRGAVSSDVVKQVTKNLITRAEKTNLAAARFYSTNGSGSVSAVGQENTGWRSKWQIIPGRFTSGSFTSFLFYDPTKGEGCFFTYNGQGGITQVGAVLTGWRKTWRIVPGRFSSGSYTDLLFHDTITGEVYFYRTPGDGTISLIGKAAGTFSGVYRFYAGKFLAGTGGYDDLLLFNPLTGEVTLSRCNGRGDLAASGSAPLPWGPHNQLIVGKFWGGNALNSVLSYDSWNGQAQFCSFDGAGSYAVIGSTHFGWRKTWKIIAGRFSSSSLDDLLMYDQSNGEVYFFHTDGSGHIDQFGPMSTPWTRAVSLIPGTFNTSGYTGILFYNRYAVNF